MKKKRILFIPSTMSGGVYYYRVYTPMKRLIEKYPDNFEITIDNHWKFTDTEKDEIGKNYDIVCIHQCLYSAEIQEAAWKMIIYCKKEYGTKFVLDIDDYWDYGKFHPYNEVCQFNAFPDKMMINFKLFDYITTTTWFFAEKIRQYNNNVVIFENAISLDDSQFSTKKNKSDKIRLGLTGGSSHTEDIKCLFGFWKHLSQKTLNKIEIVFCGYDNKNNEKITVDENGKVLERQKLEDKDNWWVQTEKKIIDGVGKDHYKRIESKDIMKKEFGGVYQDIDILLVPLKNTKFNNCKSELKIIEAGFTNTVPMCSKVIPYSNYGVDNVDCILVKDNTPKGWAKKITKLVNDTDKIKSLRSTCYNKQTKYRELELVTDKRKEFFDNLV